LQLQIPFLPSTIHTFFQLLAHFEKRQLLWCNLNLLAGFGVSPGLPPVFFNEKGTKAPDFNSVPLCQRLANFIEKQLYDRFSFRFGQVV
jgi:hypothetical protein